jgi:hypothetical protein
MRTLERVTATARLGTPYELLPPRSPPEPDWKERLRAVLPAAAGTGGYVFAFAPEPVEEVRAVSMLVWSREQAP